MRKLIAGLVVMLVLAGCSSSGIEYTAPPAQVGDNVAEQNGYEVRNVQKFEYNETVNVSNVDYDINTTNWVTSYTKEPDVDTGDRSAATYVIISTPSMEIANQEVSPLAAQPTESLISRISSQSKNLKIHEKVDESNVTNEQTGEEVTVEKYNATITRDAQEIDGYVLTSVIKTEDAVIITIGAYPQRFDEQVTIHELIRNTETVEEPPETPSNSSE